MIVRITEHLRHLVAFNTCNPPRDISQDGIIKYLIDALPGFQHQIWDYAEGRISLLAVRGQPQLMFNFHLDTVPSSDDWSSNPWQLEDKGEILIGLGACDIKGAAAAMLTAVEQSAEPVALLFTTDEEAGNSHCVRTFIQQHNQFDRVIVAEPTQCQVVTAHRGIVTATVNFTGIAGHASSQSGVGFSATHQAIAWGQAALKWAARQNNVAFEGLHGLRFNIGVLKGGIKANMIAPSCSLTFGFRTLPNQDQSQLLDEISQITGEYSGANLQPGFLAPALNNADSKMATELLESQRVAVDFWTEAALFNEAGLDAVVWGPGDIAQAHTADEWVSKNQLITMVDHYQRIILDGGA